MTTKLELHRALLESSKRYSEISVNYEGVCDELNEAETAEAIVLLNELRTRFHELQNEYAALVG